MPSYLAGREEDLRDVEQIFEALAINMPVQSVIFSGLRGVGKTVLLNSLQKIAEEKIYFADILKWKRGMISFLRLLPVHRLFCVR